MGLGDWAEVIDEMEEMEEDLERVLRVERVMARTARILRTCGEKEDEYHYDDNVKGANLNHDTKNCDEVSNHDETVDCQKEGCQCADFSEAGDF